MSGRPKESFPGFSLNSEMAVNTDSENHFPDSLNGKQDFAHELSTLYTPQESDDGILSVQVLEFKTSLLEAVEELHIHRDAEMRFKEQMNTLVLEKQEIEWEKESLQHKIDTLVNQHNESLAAKKKQARITGIEGEKGRYQLSAEIKEKEIGSLKEELKSLQLFKYSLEKKLSELEQKLQLQVQTKDSHLSQLGEVERRFGALSRQCVGVKQNQETLALNVEEAMRLNKKLTFLNKKQETTINSLKQDVEKVNSELIKSKVCSVCKFGEGIFHRTVREQQMQQLQHRLHAENEMNKRLTQENAAVTAEKREVMNSLQQTQQLLQTQTEALCRAELELSTQREEYQALKTEHKLFQEKIEEKEGRIDSMVEEHNRSKTEWINEEKILQEMLHTDHEELKYVREAYDHLQEKCKQLSSHTTQQAELTQRQESGLMEFKKDNRKLISRNSEISVNARCETMARPGENGSSQDDGEPVHLQVSTKQGPSDCDEIGDTRQAPDKGGDAGPTGTVSDEHPQADNRTVIAEQASSVYNPGRADAEGTAEGRHAVDPACVLLQPLESSCTLARLPAGGTPIADAADALGVCGAVAGQETDSSKHKSLGGNSRPIYGRPENGFSPSANICHEGGFTGKVCGPESKLFYGRDGDPFGEGTKDRKQEETGCIPKTVTQTTDKHDRRSQKGTGSECTGRVEAAAFETDLNEGHPVLLESSYLCALSQRHVEHPSGTSCLLTSEANKVSHPEDSDINPLFSVAHSDKGMITDINKSKSTLPHILNLCPNDPASAATQSSVEMEQKETKVSNKHKHGQVVMDNLSAIDEAPGHRYSQAACKNCDIDVTPKAETSHDSAPVLSHHSDTMAGTCFCPELNLSQSSVSAPSNTSESKRADGNCCAQSSLAQNVEGQHALECNEENKPNEESFPLTHPGVSDTPDMQNIADNPPDCNDLGPNGHREGEERQTCGETGSLGVPRNKRYRSSFELEPFMKAKRASALQNIQGFVTPLKENQNNGEISRSLTPPIPSFLKRNTKILSGFQDVFSLNTISMLQKDKPLSRDPPAITRAADMLNTSSIHPQQRRGPLEEWNAIAQAFCETSAELESTRPVDVYIPFGSTLSTLPASSVGISTLPASTLPGLPSPSGYTREGRVPGPGSEGRAPCSENKEQSEFSTQISDIERFLCSERLKLPRKRKVDAESANEH